MKYEHPDQLDLLGNDAAPPAPRESHLRFAFNKFEQENPHVFDLFRHYAEMVRARGHEHYSARAIFHRMRWHTDVETTDDEGFKLNNNLTPFFARKLMTTDARFVNFFRNRTSVADA